MGTCQGRAHLPVASHRTGGHYPSAAGAISAPPINTLPAHLLHRSPMQSHLQHLRLLTTPVRIKTTLLYLGGLEEQASVGREEDVLGAGGTWWRGLERV